jgi:hypothetical protein
LSLTAVRPYFRARLNSLGFSEWKDPFGPNEIPSTIIDRAYHIEVGTIGGVGRNNLSQEVSFGINIRVYFKGFNYPEKALDDALLKSELIIKECMTVENWATTPIKGVELDSLELEPLDNELNDNVVFALVRFVARVNLCVES